jgi:hypothetical protein
MPELSTLTTLVLDQTLSQLVPYVASAIATAFTGLATFSIYKFNTFISEKAKQAKQGTLEQYALSHMQITKEQEDVINRVITEGVKASAQKGSELIKSGAARDAVNAQMKNIALDHVVKELEVLKITRDPKQIENKIESKIFDIKTDAAIQGISIPATPAPPKNAV